VIGDRPPLRSYFAPQIHQQGILPTNVCPHKHICKLHPCDMCKQAVSIHKHPISLCSSRRCSRLLAELHCTDLLHSHCPSDTQLMGAVHTPRWILWRAIIGAARHIAVVPTAM
jgi:hypothetical protein